MSLDISQHRDDALFFTGALMALVAAIIFAFNVKKKLHSDSSDKPQNAESLQQRILELNKKLKENEDQMADVYSKKSSISSTPLNNQDKESTHLRNLNLQIQKAREEERRRIAREIHDELGQQLTALKFDINWIKKKLNVDQENISNKARQALTLIDQTIHSVRKISSDLRPGILDDLGLIPALEWQCMDFEKRTGIKCSFRSYIQEVEFSTDFSVNVFRILQETLTNVARHSGATRVKINIALEKDIFSMSIIDNGTGINKGEKENKTSFGILGMKERALIYGGELSISGSSEDGTTVRVKIPLPKQGKSLWPEQNETRS
jgi:signal transduction histidine kinase